MSDYDYVKKGEKTFMGNTWYPIYRCNLDNRIWSAVSKIKHFLKVKKSNSVNITYINITGPTIGYL